MAERVVSRFRLYFMITIALMITDELIGLPGAVSAFIHFAFVLTAVLQIAEWVQETAVSVIKRQAYRNPTEVGTLSSAVNIIKYFVNVAIWVVAALLILDNVNTDVTALLAGLGIGGLAIGLAAQGAFRDLFSALSIIFDKPFQVGDTIRYDPDTWGDVEEIGLKTTRIRSRHGEQVIISNTNLLDKEIHNLRRMNRRRIEVEVSIVYQTAPELAVLLAEPRLQPLHGGAFDRSAGDICYVQGKGSGVRLPDADAVHRWYR